MHVDKLPAGSVPFEKWIGSVHFYSHFWHHSFSFGVAVGIWPRPGGGHDAIEGDVAYFVVLDLVHVTVDHIDFFESFDDFVDLFAIFSPEIPPFVDLL